MDYSVKEGTKGLIFDLDGTLANTMPYHYEAWRSTCRLYGMEMSSDYLKAHMGMPGWIIAGNIIKQYGLEKELDPNLIFDRKKEAYIKLRDKVTAIEPVKTIVQKYHGKLIMAVGTGGYRAAAERTLRHIGMDSYFNIMVTADEVKQHKPHPETFLRCAGIMKLKPSDIEVFEDGALGLEAAARAGMHPVDIRPWVNSW